MKNLNLIVMAFTLTAQTVFAANSIETKTLKRGESTIEALGEVKDSNVYTSLRVVKCAESESDLPAKGVFVASFPDLQNALLLTSGSTVILRRAAFNVAYSKALPMQEFVRISCE